MFKGINYFSESLSYSVEQGKKNKKFFWVPAIAPLISVIVSTFFVFITHAEKEGVEIVSTSHHYSFPLFWTK